ncbi:MAG: M43 family zinc metalloprotease [Bacteroidota bacterium]
MRKIVVVLIILSTVLTVSAQERCATVEYKKLQQQNNPKHESEDQFEEWIQQKLIEHKSKSNNSERTNSSPSIIPVVVHIIHNGEPVGTGTNIPDAQVFSQIDVLNKDYQRLNADSSQTPQEFQSVAGIFEVQFVLAKQDPEGLPATGIVRVKGTKTGWNLADDAELKSLSYWNSNDYLNIWVTNIVDAGGFIGYAKFPISTLPELSNSPNDPFTDGVVIHYDAFGSADDGPFILDPKFNKGRTATHEIGHFFGLYHIWGDDDGGCSGDDYVTDTPNQGDNYNGECPVHPQVSCGSNDMFQNYMDYTNDDCMNIFTGGQVGRMVIVLQNSPRRATLPTSKGATAPPVVALDLGIKSISSPGITACAGSNVPSVVVRNYGTNSITSARIQVKLNSVIKETRDITISLSNLETGVITFNPIDLSAGSSNQIDFTIIQSNGQVDENTSNDIKSQNFSTSQSTALPLSEVFNSTPSSWPIQNPDGLTMWQNVNAPIDGASNKAMYINLHSYEEEGAVDRLVTPNMNFSTLTNAILKFDRAYAQYPGVTSDVLRVLISADCGADLSQAIEIFNKSGSALASSVTTSNSFQPTTQSQWVKENISLLPFSGNPNVQLIFEVTNGYGNNLYLDNVQVLADDLIDLALVTINTPSPVICITDPSPSISVKNLGSQTITSFKITSIVSGTVKSQTISNVSIIPGDDATVTLNSLSLSEGSNAIRFEVSEPNNLTDEKTDNNTLEFMCVVNSVQSGIPLREKFESDFQSSWTTVSQGDQKNYDVANTNFGKSLVYPGFTNTTIGEEAWLVSPVLDLSRTSEASMFFDVSYSKQSTGNENLRILSSNDCGVNFITTLFNQNGDSFSTTNSTPSWIPAGENDWKNQFVYLDNLIGQQNARLAFIVTNDHGNNLYLDNIEFFIDDNQTPVKINSAYKVYPSESSSSSFEITFNLPEKGTAYLQVYNLMGQVIVNNVLPETLNQTYTVDFSGQVSGIYIVRVQTNAEAGATKIFLVH